MDNKLLEDHLLERRIYERLGKHDRICELKYPVRRGLVLERLVQNLRERLRGVPNSSDSGSGSSPSRDEMLRWSIQAAEGAAYIHEKGVIQADLTCINLLLDRDGNLKFCDFAGSSIDGSTALVMPDTDFERPDMDYKVPSIQDDLFQLGSVIYEIWTGNAPSRRGDQQWPDLASIPPASTIMKCWRGHYQSAAETMLELEAQAVSMQ
ncbi:hypothetical protein A1O3_03728 [Capronia epimyces CBS 606.96]|uniref:Protein kinase domain-containing protein n=1 Tax=Capronia epimyces CBS 606.96 TaxID=1182542 RepID=W9YWW1_9EURO|nr:uncharacterized protein A1O3_03728 [Capronia epimyces CBS 606.96]EXJ86774.1 hypothetical protein A1O3_03728 [Capronia epimyces CBS 606.96]